jgi:hypothetical protein
MTIKIINILFSIPALLLMGGTVQAQSNVTGKVMDIHGNAVIAASVRVKGSGLGASTDTLGFFTLRVNPKDLLVVSAVGYLDTTLAAGDRNLAAIVLQPATKTLGEAVVSGVSSGAGQTNLAEQAAREQTITNIFQEYVTGTMFSNGGYQYSGLQEVNGHPAISTASTIISGFGPLNTINAGVMVPQVTHQEDTRGSRYLLKSFAHGIIVDNDGHVMTDPTRLLNYDKIDGQLLIAEGSQKYLEVDKDKVMAFALKAEDTAIVFLNVPILSKVNYFVLLANGPKYSAYKSIRSRFVKANFQDRGLVETGNNYDEYVDKQTYFWVEGSNNAGVFELKKKSIKEAFAGEKAKVDAYFAQHKFDDIDDTFVKNLIIYLNKS